MAEKIKDMTRGKPAGLIFTFALPLMLGNVFQQLYTVVDTAVVGQFVGVEALASIGAADWPNWMVLGIVTGFAQGFCILVSQNFGAGDYDGMRKSISHTFGLGFALAILITALAHLIAHPLLLFLNTPDDVIDGSLLYLRITFSGIIVIMAYNLFSSVLRALGDSKSPLYAMIIAALLNIALDLVFVMVFKWGVFGAALASVLSQMFAFMFCLLKIRRIDCVKLDRAAWRINGKLFRKLFLFGLPLAIQYVVINIGGTFVQATINLQGSSFVAGYTAVNKLYGILECSAIAMGAAFTTFVSQNYGAGKFRRVRENLKTCNLLAVGCAAAVMLPVLLLRGVLPRLFLDVDQAGATEAIAVAMRYLTNMGLSLPMLYLIYVYRSNLQSIGDSFWSMVSGFTETLARVGTARLVMRWIGRDALFFTEPAAWFAAWTTVMIPYYFYRKKHLPMEDR